MRRTRGLLAPSILILAGQAAAAAGTPPAPPTLVPHRAVYDVALAPGGAGAGIEAAQGRIAIEFYGDACEGYTTRVRQVTRLEGEDGRASTIDANSATYESPDGELLKFRSETRADGAPIESVDGEASRGDAQTLIALRAPEAERVAVAGEPVFPTSHVKRLIERALAGETITETRVFDGSGDGRTVYDTLAVIGPPKPDGAPGEGLDALASLRRWPVRLSYFEPGPGERTPAYAIGFTLFENGVSSDLVFDFGEYRLVGALAGLEILGTGVCER